MYVQLIPQSETFPHSIDPILDSLHSTYYFQHIYGIWIYFSYNSLQLSQLFLYSHPVQYICMFQYTYSAEVDLH